MKRFRFSANVPVIDRIMAFVDKQSNGCWIWLRGKTPDGYGSIRVDRKMYRVPRLMMELQTGRSIPREVDVCHKCDTPSCVNPEHLFLGTRHENVRDCIQKGRWPSRRSTKCRNGHSLTTPGRGCRICKAEYQRRRRAQRKTDYVDREDE